LEDVLRQAGELAARRRGSASVHDLIRATLAGGPASPASALLMRTATDPLRLERWRDEPLREASAAAAPAPASEARPDLPSGVAEALLARLAQMEASFHALRAEVAADRRTLGDLLREVQGELQALRTAPAAPAAIGAPAATTADWQGMDVRLAAFEDRFARSSAEVAAGLSGRFEEAQAGLRHRQEEAERQLTAMGERQIALEASVRAQLQSAEEASEARERDLDHINEVLDRLRDGQQTLGENLREWQGDIGIVSNKLQQLEQTIVDALGQLSLDVQALRNASYDNGTRRGQGFKRWLYGTGNVFQSSWREETASLRAAAGRPRSERE
jgi:hypothetical protein